MSRLDVFPTLFVGRLYMAKCMIIQKKSFFDVRIILLCNSGLGKILKILFNYFQQLWIGSLLIVVKLDLKKTLLNPVLMSRILQIFEFFGWKPSMNCNKEQFRTGLKIVASLNSTYQNWIKQFFFYFHP